MHIPALLAALLLALASPLAMASEGHDEETPADDHAAGVSGPEMQPGESWSLTISDEGTFDYHCHPHPWMLAQLRVLPSNGSVANHTINITEPSGEPFENWTFSPKVYDVRVGDNVTWVNAGTVMHRVTQTVGEHIAHVGTVGGSEEAGAHADEVDHDEAGVSNIALWLVVAALGVGCVLLWVRGKKA